MIGGTDLIFTLTHPNALEDSVTVIRTFWPDSTLDKVDDEEWLVFKTQAVDDDIQKRGVMPDNDNLFIHLIWRKKKLDGVHHRASATVPLPRFGGSWTPSRRNSPPSLTPDRRKPAPIDE
jgi:hypothetical protein